MNGPKNCKFELGAVSLFSFGFSGVFFAGRGIFPLQIPKVQRNAKLVDLENS